MSNTNTTVNRVVLTKIDGEIEGALELVGRAMGSEDKAFQAKCLLSCYELMASAQSKITQYLIANELPHIQETASVMKITQPVVIEGEFTVAQSTRPPLNYKPDINYQNPESLEGHRVNCNYRVFATACNCDFYEREQKRPILASAKKLIEYLKPGTPVEQDDTVDQQVQEIF